MQKKLAAIFNSFSVVKNNKYSHQQHQQQQQQHFDTTHKVLPLALLATQHSTAAQQQYQRNYSSINNQQALTHIDAKGKAVMVDVSPKQITVREATACAIVHVGMEIAQLIQANNIAKGDVLSIAKIAGILGAKKTAELIPLCHNIPLNSVRVEAHLNMQQHSVELTAVVRCTGRTGVEMEALTAVSVAALTVYDMCKAVSHDIIISEVRLWGKTGGKRDFKRDGDSNTK